MAVIFGLNVQYFSINEDHILLWHRIVRDQRIVAFDHPRISHVAKGWSECQVFPSKMLLFPEIGSV